MPFAIRPVRRGDVLAAMVALCQMPALTGPFIVVLVYGGPDENGLAAGRLRGIVNADTLGFGVIGTLYL
jgi:hypothetical protein